MVGSSRRGAWRIAAVVLLAACEATGLQARDGAVDPDGGPWLDGGSEPDAVVPADDAGSGRVIYPSDRRHSPITADVAANLRAIRAREPAMRDDVFAKVGASATASTSFLRCFGTDRVDLGGRDVLEETRAQFRGGDAAGIDPFRRESLTAVSGWNAGRAIDGDPSPLSQELDAITPRFAVVMYGTNDINLGDLQRYGVKMLDLADALTDRGVIPLMTSVMPRDDDPLRDADVPLYNLVSRAIAQGRGVPYVDFHRELTMLPDHGLGSDGIHPTTSPRGACILNDEGLRYGYNVRNLIALEQLDRARRATLTDAPPPDPSAPRMRGDGSPDAPFAIDALPFTDLRSTLFSPHRAIDAYEGCRASQNEAGPELYYRLELRAPTAIRAIVIARTDVDVDVHLLDQRRSGEGCVARGHQQIEAALDAGTYFVAVDTFVDSGGRERAGEFVLLVVEQ